MFRPNFLRGPRVPVTCCRRSFIWPNLIEVLRFDHSRSWRILVTTCPFILSLPHQGHSSDLLRNRSSALKSFTLAQYSDPVARRSSNRCGTSPALASLVPSHTDISTAATPRAPPQDCRVLCCCVRSLSRMAEARGGGGLGAQAGNYRCPGSARCSQAPAPLSRLSYVLFLMSYPHGNPR